MAACWVFEQGLIEVVFGSFGLAEVLTGDGKDISSKLQFQSGAAGGDIGADLGEGSFGVHLSFTGIGVNGFKVGEFCFEFGTSKVAFVSSSGIDEAVKNSDDLSGAGFVDLAEAEREEFFEGGTGFGEFVANAPLALADGAADELQGLVFGDGAARLVGEESRAGGEFRIELFVGGAGRHTEGGDGCGCTGDGGEAS